MKIKLVILLSINFFSCLLLTKKIELNNINENKQHVNVILSFDYAHEINGSQIEITSEEIEGIFTSIITGLEKNNIKTNGNDFDQIIEVKIKINERKNTYISRISAYTYSLVPHYVAVDLEYVLTVKNMNGEKIKSHTFLSESKGINFIIFFPVSIFYNPKKAFSNHLIDATDLLINQK
ncbi:hypothetical protein EHQ94_19690 [Leptospira meyeri]|uniref:hypothetical protein n=1 Tax=Leptospira meyeri TaxID=29508 RepID=UPI001083DBCD|nr:hypothetical protein [Leptospira meyeri]TGM62986.1 hypothetical protein EHQ94_19690 [Leptospira meyeri]TGM68621.1 hypothetical protein EHQ93_00195 [Leptospira meyeri]